MVDGYMMLRLVRWENGRLLRWLVLNRCSLIIVCGHWCVKVLVSALIVDLLGTVARIVILCVC